MPEETPMEMRARLEREARAERERLRAGQKARLESLVVFGVVLVLFLGVALAFLFPRYEAIQTCYSSVRAELGSSVNPLFPGFWRDLRALKSENGTQSLESFVDTTDNRGASIRQPYRCTFRYGAPASFAINFQ
ncbi:hypothetical protein [Meiothermus hypogaeus]|uniref:Uncharacterized protein n=2 Tax=Meiothermus hypogaeus TaxID=884155 RepID=A0A511R0D6_9DEIN|nr:hypothetical protein [Meiothermus hypogaeus]RIH76774.1 hypothetical protein Mhypo_02287 [Meiothermus hypogaeus]GEM82767.1 hypothetical protein MHY01S_09330 [Meiothermus hypogaeus NBRC 106114]GIW36018.1 MAG: hypothetical protein KatS3mg073_0163 [Meiothermus sp.]